MLLIVVDTLRADHLSCYGHVRNTSPNIDALARRGVLFERAFAQSSWTCPSMVSLMTGRRGAGPRFALPEEIATLAERFRDAGFATGAFVGNSLLLQPENGFGRGFERFEVLHEYAGGDALLIDWIRQSAGRRTLTWVHFNDPHAPYRPPGHHWLDYPPELPAEQRAFFRQAAETFGLVDNDASVAHIRREIGGYDDSVRWCDARIALLLAALEESGQSERTAIVIAADHGEGLWTRVALRSGPRAAALERGEPATLINTLHSAHGNLMHTELVRVPLILVAPELEARRVEQVVENVDLAPTLCALPDLPPSATWEGSSLLDVLTDPAGWTTHRRAYSATRFATTVIDQQGWQLIEPTQLGRVAEGLTQQLYDLGRDPRARRDLARQEPERALPTIQSDSISAGTQQALNALGYVQAGVVDPPSAPAKLPAARDD